MKSSILNREFQHPADGWYQIEAKGDHPNRAAGLVQVIDNESVAAIVNRFNADAVSGKLRHGNEMLIDHEHFSDLPDKETRAYGWLQELQNREDGIYGRIRWTKTGKEAVDGGDYRFFSTEYAPGDLKILNANGNTRRVRPLRLDGLTLTNMNNNRGQKPITNRGADNTLDDALSGAKSSSENTIKNKMKNIAVELGLDANTDEQGILSAVRQLKNRGDISASDLNTLRNREKLLGEENQTLLGEQIDALLDAHGVKEEKIRNRMKPVLTGLKNREDRVSTLVDFGFKQVEPGKEKPATRILNRGEGKTEQADEGNAQETAAKAEAEVSDYKIRNRCSYEDARNAVRRSKPELFGLK